MPPSVHVAGQYLWNTEAHIDTTPVADAPQWLLRLKKVDQGRGEAGEPTVNPILEETITRPKAYLDKCPPAVSGRNGHSMLLSVASKLVRGFLLDPNIALTLLKDHYNPRCEPPWTDKELAHKVQEALKCSTQPLGGMLGGPQAQPRPKPETPKILSATELDAMEFPPMKWAVQDVLPEGATIFAGPPKVGKSFLTLGLTLSIACGGTALGSIPVQ